MKTNLALIFLVLWSEKKTGMKIKGYENINLKINKDFEIINMKIT